MIPISWGNFGRWISDRSAGIFLLRKTTVTILEDFYVWSQQALISHLSGCPKPWSKDCLLYFVNLGPPRPKISPKMANEYFPLSRLAPTFEWNNHRRHFMYQVRDWETTVAKLCHSSSNIYSVSQAGCNSLTDPNKTQIEVKIKTQLNPINTKMKPIHQ